MPLNILKMTTFLLLTNLICAAGTKNLKSKINSTQHNQTITKNLAQSGSQPIPIQKPRKNLQSLLHNKKFVNALLRDSETEENSEEGKSNSEISNDNNMNLDPIEDFERTLNSKISKDREETEQINQPIVGILTIRNKNDKRKSYFFNSYAKWIESAGIRWVPIFLQETREQLMVKLNLINGVLLTGGVEDFRNL